jgi:RimJ/RimL family protein N-acetyltransferase
MVRTLAAGGRTGARRGPGPAHKRGFAAACLPAIIAVVRWPAIEVITTGRLCLEPLTVGHAAEMVAVLADPSLYEFIGGAPPSVDQLRRRYRTQVAGPPADESQWWLNWVVTTAEPRCAAGYVQATVEPRPDGLEATIAWVISPRFQGQGLASEAAGAMIRWLAGNGVGRCVAYVHPDHAASSAVARRLGLRPAEVVADGEIRWQSADAADTRT